LWLKGHFPETLGVEALAGRAGMSPSAFHPRFRCVTALKPPQDQKRQRSKKARWLMPGEGLNAADAASQARWESPFPFDRAYRRRFGIPPGPGVAVLDAEAPPAKSS